MEEMIAKLVTEKLAEAINKSSGSVTVVFGDPALSGQHSVLALVVETQASVKAGGGIAWHATVKVA